MKAIADLVPANADQQTQTLVCETHGEYESLLICGRIWTKCPACGAESVAKERADVEARRQAERLKAWERRIGGAGIPERFHTRRLETYVARTEQP